MAFSRRHFLGVSAAGLAAVAAGCDRVQRDLAGMLAPRVPDRFEPPRGAHIDPVHHVLSRVTFGPRPGDLERVRAMGVPAYLEEQLAPAAIDDTACDMQLWGRETLRPDAPTMPEWRREICYRELTEMTVIRAVNSRRQLHEVMVRFWTDHLNIAIDKDFCQVWKTVDDREVVRAHALGKFADLIRASALSPAMLTYLDQRDNKFRAALPADQPPDKPNENYARELLELHTLGVHGGYTQKDVMEVARCLTGWTVPKNGMGRGTPLFRATWHDDGAKVVLGQPIPAKGGAADLDRVLAIVTRHPSTARHIATKLCRRFVADTPPAALVDRVAQTFDTSDGDIAAMLRVILHSPEFAASAGQRLKRPFRYVVSALRAVGADTDGGPAVQDTLTRMGQAPFRYPTPDGYPDEAGPWLGTMLWRWNFAVRLTHDRIAGTQVDWERLGRAAGEIQDSEMGSGAVVGDLSRFAAHVLGRTWTAAERDAVAAVRAAAPDRRAGVQEAMACLLASPGFQRC